MNILKTMKNSSIMDSNMKDQIFYDSPEEVDEDFEILYQKAYDDMAYKLICYLENFKLNHIPIMDKPEAISSLLHYLMEEI